MRLISEHLLIKPLSQYELESLLQTIRGKDEFEIAELEASDFTWEITKALEDSYLPALKNHSNHYLLYTIWLLINRKSNKIEGFISFNVSPTDKRKLELSYTFFKITENSNLISESLNATISWCTEKYNFNKFLLHDEYGSGYEELFLKYGFQKINNGLYHKVLSDK